MNKRESKRIPRLGAVAAGLALAAALAVCATALAGTDYGPDTCLNGFVWRGAVPTDHVCVAPAVRSQIAQDNAQAVARRSPTGGLYGPDTCLPGYVWRDAFANDHVCVAPAVRSQAQGDNLKAGTRRNDVLVSLGTWRPQQVTCSGNVCSQTSDDAARYAVRADRLNLGAALVALVRLSDGRTTWSKSVPVAPYTNAPGGWLAVQTPALNCSGGAHTAPNAYFIVKDGFSGRTSLRRYVTTYCLTL